jgi:DNA-binding NarL/FixJ family response regulator
MLQKWEKAGQRGPVSRQRGSGMRILIADDHRLIVEGVRQKLAELGPDIDFLEATTVDELHAALSTNDTIDLALIDLAMPGANGRQHLLDTVAAMGGAPVVVLSGSEDPAIIQELLALGVHGFIPKAYSPDVMLGAIRLVLSGGTYIPPMMLHPPAASSPMGTNGNGSAGNGAEKAPEDAAALERQLRALLTERQMDVLRLLAHGKPNKVIARDLGISEGTVKIHLAAIFRALHVRNRLEALVASQHLRNV